VVFRQVKSAPSGWKPAKLLKITGILPIVRPDT